MKKINYALLLSFMFLLIPGCNNSDELFDEMQNEELKNSQPHMVTVPFKADFIGTYDNDAFIWMPEDEICEDIYMCKVFVHFEGNATHLGKMYGRFEFCACGPENPDVPTPNNRYAPSDSYMVAANGDILYVTISGQVIQGRADDHPEYVTSYFRDPFVILGGTGRFEGATGSGWSDDYNSSLDNNSHHHWTGTITMLKGKK